MALAGCQHARSYLTRNVVRLLLVASLVPIVVSANRGLWVGLGVGLVYAAVRVALLAPGPWWPSSASWPWSPPWSSSPRWSATSATAWPARTATNAASLGSQALLGALEQPLLGYGGPRESADLVNAPEIGTHGQIYLVIFSHGPRVWPSSSAGGCGPCG